MTTFEIRKTKSKTHGHIDVIDPSADHPFHYGLCFFLGPHPRGFMPVPVKFGKNIAVAYAARLVVAFAKQNGCKYVYRADSSRPLRKI